MAKNISLIRINTSKEKVWEAVTKPEYVKLWQFGSELITNWEPGSTIWFRTVWEGNVFEQWGKVIEYKPCEMLKYSLFAPRPDLEDKPENYFKMGYILTEENGITTLQIVQDDDRANAKQEAEQGEDNPVLQSLKKVAEEI